VKTVTYAPTRVLTGLKTISYAANMLAGRLAKEQGADEALLVTPHGRVLEGPTWSFFWVAGGRLHTPPLSDGILDSITRGRLLDECDVTEAPCTLDDVRAAEEAFIASSVREVMPIAAVDDIVLPQAPGPATRAAHEAFRRRVARELEQEAAAA
jgi:branched-chain amino acid aminotransferase